MTQPLAIRHCRIVAPEKLSDRFLSSGLFFQQESTDIKDQVLLAYVFEITKPWFPSSKVLPTLLETLHEQHGRMSTSKDLGDQFEDVLKALNERLNALSEAGETDWIGNLNGLIMVLSGNELHFSQTGRCPTYLLQNNRIRQITDEPSAEREPHPLKTFSNLASGELKSGDYLLISNQELYNEISLDGLRRIIGTDQPGGSAQVITRELKKERNLGVSSIIIQAVSPAEAALDKPAVTEIILEEEMRSFAKKLQSKLSPYAAKARAQSVKLGKASIDAAKSGANAASKTLAPAAAIIIQKGAQGAASLSSKVSPKGASPVVEVVNDGEVIDGVETPETGDETTPVETPQSTVKATAKPKGAVVEIIRPRNYVEEVAKPANYVEGSVIPLDEFSLGSSTLPMHIPKKPHVPFTERLRAIVRNWVATPESRRVTALAGAVVLIAVTGIGIASRQHTVAPTATSNQVEADLTRAEELAVKAKTAIDLKQNVEAAREIESGTKLINSLSNLNETQKKRSETIWTSLTGIGDSLSTATRFASPATTYSFTAASQNVVTSLPYFYGFNGNTVLRSGQGDASATQSSQALPDSSDSVVSMTKSEDGVASAFILTKKNKVYGVAQNGASTKLNFIQPSEGEFPAGDALASYLSNLYVLDSKSGILWKHTGTGTVYGKGVSVIDSTKYDIKKSVSFAIDGSIYFLKQDGNVLSFTRGLQDEFSLKNLPPVGSAMVNPLQIITNEDMDGIYILDGGVTVGTHSTARVMEFTKDGTFVRQYAFPKEYTQIKGFDIDPKEKKLWVTDGTRISEFAF